MTSLNLEPTLNNIAFVSLLIMTIWHWGRLIYSVQFLPAIIGTVGMATANLSLTCLLGIRWVESKHFPLSNLYESLLFLAWGFTLFHLLTERLTKVQFTGVITAPVALLITSFASFSLPKEMQRATALIPALQSNWLMMHVTIMMLSYVALLAGSLFSIAFLVVNYSNEMEARKGPVEQGDKALVPSVVLDASKESITYGEGACEEPLRFCTESNTRTQGSLKMPNSFVTIAPRHNPSFFKKKDLTMEQTPSMASNTDMSAIAQTLDNLSYRTLGLGFPFLTIGILSGAVWANEAWGSYWSWDPKETWAFITWLVFAIYLHTRLTKGWKGTGPAFIAAGGFIVVWVCYLGVNLLGTGLHSYGWFKGGG